MCSRLAKAANPKEPMQNLNPTIQALALTLAFALGCGGLADDTQPANPDAERPLYLEGGDFVTGEGTIEIPGLELAPDGDIGQASQPLIFPKAGASNPGIKPGSYEKCFQHDSNQNCVIPHRKDLIWHVYDGTNAQKAVVRGHVNQWITDMINMGLEQCSAQACWKFREAPELSEPDLTHVIAIAPSVNGVCPGATDTVRGFLCWGGQTTGVAKGSSGLFGTYHRFADHIVPVVTIDYGQIMSLPGLNGTQRGNVLRQVIRAALLGAAGKGLSQIGGTRCNNSLINDPNVQCVETESDVCWMNNFGDEGNVDTVYRLNPDCGS